ncbi:alpha/beta hydrolase [Pontibacter liquoris]|uniref:alpha/beta hydrolase n=1 Tax=Pontibacter liquoris TaxID=2905677 RepID=UPI001FA6D12E|nr:alpha/beta hydrolase [Pontibacter liquoris]
MQENKLTIPRTARYYTLGTPSPQIKQLWLVCHGYGQLARFFLRHFNVLNNGQTLLVAPEALSRFYLDGFSGRVGATWMTKEDRLAEIDDYVAYLDLLIKEQRKQLPADVRVTVLGFSQGAVTVSRWVAAGKARCHRLILWAGAFPEDVDFAAGREAFAHLPVTLVYGTQDALIKEDMLVRHQQVMAQLGITPAILSYEGGHTLHAETLLLLHKAENS